MQNMKGRNDLRDYKITIPKEETKQETDEKGKPLTYWGGLKKQAERMYSEEEVCKIIKARENYLTNQPKNSLHISIKDWFKQFKKKYKYSFI